MTSEFIIHVVDDEETVRHSLSFLLSSSGFPARAHASASAFLDIAGELENACLVTDLRMPDLDGIELLRRLRARDIAIPVIIVTGHGDIQAAVEAMKAGASDFIEKPFSDETLLATISAVLMDAEGHNRQRQRRQAARAKLEMLSHRERQVLEGVVTGLANKVIAHNLGLSPRTVEVYRATIMAKLQARNVAELVRIAIQTDDGEQPPG